MGKWSSAEKTALGMIFYVVGFMVVLLGAAMLCFQREIFESTGLVTPTPLAIMVTLVGVVVTIIGDILRRASRKKK